MIEISFNEDSKQWRREEVKAERGEYSQKLKTIWKNMFRSADA